MTEEICIRCKNRYARKDGDGFRIFVEREHGTFTIGTAATSWAAWECVQGNLVYLDRPKRRSYVWPPPG